MTNLTEQWVKQTLPLGWYYIKLQDGSIEIQQYIGGFLFDVNNVVVEVLAEVPSYNEYQKLLSDQLAKNEGVEINAELNERLKKTQKLELDLRRENRKLKELLKLNNILNKGSKSIYAWLKEDTAGEQKKLCADMFDKTVEMMSEISQVLGEE